MSSTPSIKAFFDYLVIGAGSGGIASARRAASYGAKTGIIEHGRIGGTCVNVGCVPKKIMWNASSLSESIHDAKHYGYTIDSSKFSWQKLKQARDTHIHKLNTIYDNLLSKSNVTWISGSAKFISKELVQVGEDVYSARHILVATGSHPSYPQIPGHELGISSDDFFSLEECPKRVAIVGAGYIAIELAGIFTLLGAETHLLIRYDQLLRNFDTGLSTRILENLKKSNVHVHPHAAPRLLEREDGTLTLHTGENLKLDQLDSVLWAIGRSPKVESLQLDLAGVQYSEKGHILVNKWHQTNVENIYALGDVIGKADLTPVAIAAGRNLSAHLFKKSATLEPFDYSLIPTVFFTHPPAATVGLSEKEAKNKFGEDKIKVYQSDFINLYDSLIPSPTRTLIKLITMGEEEKVIGLHMVGRGVDEILQGFAVAIQMGACKRDFDKTLAIHPTASEEVVTLN